MSERKPCVLEGAVPAPAAGGGEGGSAAPHGTQPCALLSPSGCPVAPPAAPSAPPEDESADPVGDGHSDAEWAARHPAGSPPPSDRD